MKTLHNCKYRAACIHGVWLLLLCTAFMASALLPTPAGAQIYRWQDEQGYWHFTEGPGSQSQNPPPGPAPSEAGPSQDTPETARGTVSALPAQAGLLWRIGANGQKASYLLGTIHSEDPRVTQLKPAVAGALDGCDRFVMEMILDTEAIMQFSATMLLEEGADLEALVGKALYDHVVSALADYGMPEPMIRRFKPWVVIAMLSMPKSGGGLILDMVLYQRATSQGKPASGLESAQEQLAVFEGLSIRDQIELLEMTLKQHSSQPQAFEQLIEAYAADDLNRIANIAKLDSAQARIESARNFMVRLNDDRNRRMVQRIIPYLQKGNSFIAVGALHLAGPRGILSLIMQNGYSAESVR